MTLIGFALGGACVGLAFFEYYMGALLALLLNRLCDGLDGALARLHDATSDLGGFLDITSDFFLWAALPLAFIWQMPEAAWAGALLLSSFAMSMTVFLAFATMAEKRGLETNAQGEKSFFYLDGLAEGTETILFFAACCIWPTHFALFATIFAAMVYLSVAGRVVTSWRVLSS